MTAVLTRPSKEYAESRLKSVLVRLADRIMEDIEIAQRIRSMMENVCLLFGSVLELKLLLTQNCCFRVLDQDGWP